MSLRKGNTIISGLGSEGYSPSASVSKSGNTATITITDKNGTTTAEVYDGGTPEVITSSASTYTIDNLYGNRSYKLSELTSLTITAIINFDRESIIYFSSGNTATSISLPDSITNLGDAPTMTTLNNVNTGTCQANKSYIISIINFIAVWKAY